MKTEISFYEATLLIRLIKTQPVSISRDFYEEEIIEELLKKLQEVR